MAVFPCDIGQHRYGGQQRSAYITFIDTARPSSHKLRLCDRHLAEVHAQAERHLELIDDDGNAQMSMVCQFEDCVEPRASGIYLKTYPGGQDYRQFAGDFCEAHGRAVLLTLHYGESKSM